MRTQRHAASFRFGCADRRQPKRRGGSRYRRRRLSTQTSANSHRRAPQRKSGARRCSAVESCIGSCNRCPIFRLRVARVQPSTIWRAPPRIFWKRSGRTSCAKFSPFSRTPNFAQLFAPGSRAEVPIVGRIPRPDGDVERVPGQLDRLIVTDDAILIADYKTDGIVPGRIEDVPLPYIAQLALYRALLIASLSGKNSACGASLHRRPQPCGNPQPGDGRGPGRRLLAVSLSGEGPLTPAGTVHRFDTCGWRILLKNGEVFHGRQSHGRNV